jgi:hypothetical protein
MFNAKANMDAMNSQIATQEAGAAAAEEQTRQGVQGLQLKAQRSQMLVDFASHGLEVGEGSARSGMISADEMARIDQQMTQYDYDKKRYGYLIQATEATAQKGIDKLGASAAQTQGYINTASAVLGGGSSFADKWLNASQSGSLSGNAGGLTATVVGPA